jgi:cytochrome P450
MTMARPDTEVVYDPATYVGGVPYQALARLRRESPVVWAQEIPVLGWPGGPGFWLGAHLARTQMAALLREVLARTSTLSYTGEPSYLRSNFQRGVKRLPLAWSAA